ncbi:MAG: hypothetical protein IPL27_07090 [Lewinellaceae bacterium]|nr:hypothetical protein [Lewinellaceae bacterium]
MKTNYYFIVALLIAFFWTACGSDPSPKTGEELEKAKTELEAKKKELADKQEIARIEKELQELNQQIKQVNKEEDQASGKSEPGTKNATPSATNTGPQSRIIGTGVTMRKDASVQSDKISSFNANEAVTVLETKNVDNDKEAVLTKAITLTGGGSEIKLPKGKAVVIEEYKSESNTYLVTYQDPQKGKMSADIDASAIETITYSTWYRVKRSNGQTGWVLGKFLQNN